MAIVTVDSLRFTTVTYAVSDELHVLESGTIIITQPNMDAIVAGGPVMTIDGDVMVGEDNAIFGAGSGYDITVGASSTMFSAADAISLLSGQQTINNAGNIYGDRAIFVGAGSNVIENAGRLVGDIAAIAIIGLGNNRVTNFAS